MPYLRVCNVRHILDECLKALLDKNRSLTSLSYYTEKATTYNVVGI